MIEIGVADPRKLVRTNESETFTLTKNGPVYVINGSYGLEVDKRPHAQARSILVWAAATVAVVPRRLFKRPDVWQYLDVAGQDPNQVIRTGIGLGHSRGENEVFIASHLLTYLDGKAAIRVKISGLAHVDVTPYPPGTDLRTILRV